MEAAVGAVPKAMGLTKLLISMALSDPFSVSNRKISLSNSLRILMRKQD